MKHISYWFKEPGHEPVRVSKACLKILARQNEDNAGEPDVAAAMEALHDRGGWCGPNGDYYATVEEIETKETAR